MQPGDRGTVAETWIVRAGDLSRFVKAIPTGRASVPVERSMPLQARLWDAGFTSMARPVATTDGRLTTVAGDHTVVVHELIDGVATADVPFDAFVDLLARLHATTINAGDLVETFEDTTRFVEPFVAEVRATQRPDLLGLAVKAAVERLGRDLGRGHRRGRAGSGRRSRRGRHESSSLTHYDAPNERDGPSGRHARPRRLGRSPARALRARHLEAPHRSSPGGTVPWRAIAVRFRRTSRTSRRSTTTCSKWYFEEIEGLGDPVVVVREPPEVRARYLRWFEGAVPFYEAALRRLDRGELAWTSAVAEAASPPAQQRERQSDDQQER